MFLIGTLEGRDSVLSQDSTQRHNPWRCAPDLTTCITSHIIHWTDLNWMDIHGFNEAHYKVEEILTFFHDAF